SIPSEFANYYNELSTRYRLIEKIGEGAFSLVFKAFDKETNTFIAIKIIDKKNMKTDQINSVLKEIAIMTRVEHPNITKLYSYLNSNNSRYCFLFLEYLSGGEIFNQIIKYTYFSEDLSRHIIRQVAHSVKYLHDSGIVHRDIKPENLLFVPNEPIPRPKKEQLAAKRKSDDNNKIDEGKFVKHYGAAGIGTIKLADFGLSTVLYNEDMKAKTPCGTVGYTSPEQHLNLGYNKKVDIWAIGCVLYTLVVGFPPFYSTTQDSKDISIKVSKGDYKFLSPWFDEVSNECKNLISNLLTVDPEKRYSIDQLLKDPWMLKGYEDDQTVPIKSIAADDAPPSTTFDQGLFTKLNHNNAMSQSSDNLLDGLTTPRAEAIRLVFDTGNVMQREGTPPTSNMINQHHQHHHHHQQQHRISTNLGVVEENETIEVLMFPNRRDDSDDDEDEDEYDSDSNDEYTPKTFAMLSQSPSYKTKKYISPTLKHTNTNNIAESFSTTTTATDNSCTSSIVACEIEDSNTGTRRKSSISFQMNHSKSSRSGSITSSIAHNQYSHHSVRTTHSSCYPRTPQPLEVYSDFDEEDDTDYDRTPCDTSNYYTPTDNSNKPLVRPIPSKKYAIEDDHHSGDDELMSNMLNDNGHRSMSFDLKLTDSTILSRRKFKGSAGCGPK
ncbi:hypothetical protein CANARDRAFT_182790, partial [[Candida] arabinofermentans NRRL YB-2248]